MTPDQCREARRELHWTASDLSSASGLSREAILLFEAGHRALAARDRSRVEAALEAAGVVFLDGDYTGPSVRLRQEG